MKGDLKKTEYTQDKIIKHSIKTPLHAALNGTKRVGQTESSDMMNQISSSKTTHAPVSLGKVKESVKEPKQSRYENRIKLRKTTI